MVGVSSEYVIETLALEAEMIKAMKTMNIIIVTCIIELFTMLFLSSSILQKKFYKIEKFGSFGPCLTSI